MNNGDMFGDLNQFKTQAFYDEHPEMILYTPEKTYRIELFSGHLFDPAKETLPLFFTEMAAFEQYAAEIKSRSLFASDTSIEAGDRLITLATCSYEFSDARFILTGKLVEIQETI
jgi:sortase B